MTAILTAGPCEAIGENAALEVAAEVAFDRLRQSVAHRVVRGRASQERFKVVLHDLVESRLGRAPRTIDGSREAVPLRWGSRTRTSPGPLPRCR